MSRSFNFKVVLVALVAAVLSLGSFAAPAHAVYVPPVSFDTSSISPGQTKVVTLNGGTADWHPTVTSCIAVGYTDATHSVNNFVKSGFAYWNYPGPLLSNAGITAPKTLLPVFTNGYVSSAKNLHPLQMTYDQVNPIVNGVRAHSGYKLVVAYYANLSCAQPTSSVPTSVATLNILDPSITIAAPTNLHTTSVTKTSVVLSWNAVPGATQYFISIDGQQVSWGTYNPVVETTKELNNFAVGSTHTFSVQATNDIITSAKTDLKVTLQGLDPIPAPVSYVSTTELAYNKATIAWAAVPGATSYRITMPGADTYITAATTRQFTGLSSETSYTASIEAGTDGGYAPAKTYTFTTTVSPADLPQASTSVTVTSTGTWSAKLTWLAAEKATSYNIYLNDVLQVSNYTSLTYDANDLPRGTMVRFTVVGVNAKGVGNPYSVPGFTTQSDPYANHVPDELILLVCDSDILFKHCHWEGGGGATGFKVFVDGTKVSEQAEKFYDVYGLTIGTHEVKVIPLNANGDASAKTVSISITSLPSVSNFPIKNIVVSQVTNTSATLTWDAVPGATKYYVDKAGAFAFTHLAEVSSPTATISQLMPGHDYQFTITASTSTFPPSQSMTPGVTPIVHTTGTFVALPAPDAVTGINTRNTQTTSVALSWKPSNNALSYYVTLGTNAPISTTDPGTVLTGLTAATTYTVVIRPVGETPTTSSTSYTFTTAGGSGTVTGQVLATGDTKVSWTGVTGATGYKVYVANTLVATLGNVLTYTLTAPFGPNDDLVSIRAIKSGNPQVGTYTYASGGVVALGAIAFDANSSTLTPANKASLDALAASVSAHGFSKVTISTNVKIVTGLTASAAATRAGARATAMKTYLATKLPIYVQIATTSTTSSTAADSNKVSGSRDLNPSPFM